MFNKLASAAFAAALALATLAPSAHAQKALVYCPVGVDAAGCDRVVAALQSKFVDGVDRGYDGSAGTVDLNKADLNHYGVVVVPSLADNADKQPYAVLRAAAARLRLAINGRVAVYSGAPDQGSANRGDKDALIQNLAQWAAKGHTRGTSLVGLVAFLDLSDNESDRYAWVKDVSLVEVSADAELQAFPEVSTVSPRGGKLLSNGGKALRFANMASYGLHVGGRAAARTEVGATGGASGAQSVLVTYANADGSDLDDSGLSTGKVGSNGASFNMTPGNSASLASSASTPGAALTTDKADYQPGEIVTFTGTGWGANDTVTITIHEDPQWSNPDRTVKAVADASGSFTNHTFVVDQRDYGVAFTATAIGNPSGTVAQTTFTDGFPAGGIPSAPAYFTTSGSPSSCTATILPPSALPGVAAKTNINVPVCIKTTFTTNNGNSNGNQFDILWFGPSSATVPVFTTPFTSQPQNATTTVSDIRTPSAGGTWTVKVCVTGSGCNGNASNTFSSSQLEVVAKQNQTITFSAPVGKIFGDADFDPSATASSGLTVSYASTTSTVCTILSNQVHIVTAGSCSITASQIGDANYNAAPDLSRTFSIAKRSVALSATVGTLIYNTTPQGPVFTGDVGQVDITYSGVSPTAYGPSTTAPTGAGSYSWAATLKDGTNYQFSGTATTSGTFSIGKADQAILTLAGVPASAAFNSTFAVTPGGGSSSAPLTVTTAGVCSAVGNNITMTSGTGTCTVKVNRAGDDNYNPATEITASATATKINQTVLSLAGVPASAAFNSTFTVTPGGGSSSAPLTVTTAGVCSAVGNNITMTSGTGTCTVKVNRAGDDNYNPATEITASATATKINQTVLSLTGVPASAAFNSTFTVTPGGGSSSAPLTVTTAGVCSAVGNNITMTSGTGTCTVKVNRAGDDNYNPATEITASATATKINQTVLSLAGVPASAAFNSTFTVTPGGGSSSAPLTVTTAGVCSAVGNNITMTSGTGTCTVKVNRAGDDNYNPATEITASATATKINQTVLSLTGVPASAAFNSTFTVTPGGGSSSAPLTVTTAGVCSAVGNNITMTSGTGTCTVKVNRAGDDNYNPATEITASATATKINQTVLSLAGVPASAAFNSTFTVTPGGGSSSAPLTVTTAGVCSAVGNNITMTSGTGTCTVKVNRAGDDNYNPATEITASATATKINQTVLSLTGVPASAAFNSTFTVTPGGGSSSAPLTVTTAGVCSAVGNNITMTSGTGTCTVKVNRAGDDNYNPATEITASATATKINQTVLSLAGVPASAAFNSTFTVTPGGGSSSAPLTVTTAGVCSAVGNNITMTSGTGTCTVKVNRAGDDNYNPATEITASAAATKINQSAVSVTAPTAVTYGTTGTAMASGGESMGGFSFNAGGSTGCSVNGTTVSVTDASGTCILTATKAGDNNYNASAASAAFSVSLVKADQIISWATPAAITYGTNLAGVLNASVTTGNGTLSYNEGATALTTITVLNAGTHTLTAVAAATNNYNSANKMVSLTVNPAAATITVGNLVQPVNNIQSPTASATPVGSNTPVSVTFTFTYTVNGTPTQTKPTQVGVYPLDADIAAGANYTGHADGYFVVYDPAGGFVTGGGWIDSPAGAYVADPSLAGKANFGFNSKYQKGATVPTGNTEFQFQEGNLNFKSTNFQWLVIQGSTKAQFKGTGTINGTGSYNFMVTAIDGDAFTGTKKPDAFRIKITDSNGNTVYDNQIGKDETGDFATTLGGGSIVIHDK